MERVIGDSVDKHSRALDSLSSDQRKVTSDLGDAQTQLANQLHDKFAQETAARNSQHVSIEARLDCIDRSLKDSAERHVTHDRLGAEYRSALESSSQVVVAIERERKLMIEYFNREIGVESEKREALMSRLNSVDMDMQRVRGHLPILFASPKAFGT